MSGNGYRGQNDTFENHVQGRSKRHRSGDEASKVAAQNRPAISASRQEIAGISGYRLPRFKAVLFVHGCFWHRHGCKATTTPGTNEDFWRKKFDENIARDRRHIEALQDAGWRVAVVWECSLKGKSADPDEVARLVSEWLVSSEKHKVIPVNERVDTPVRSESEE
jgi:DNA mismatch endonuclease (patch repair protein)